MSKDVLGIAIADYYFNTSPAKLWVYDTIGPRVEMDVSTYFRPWTRMPALEQIAIGECRGEVLDIGAGAGSHALELQRRGIPVTALDISPKAVGVMQERGISRACQGNVFDFDSGQYDTLLLLMNGIGLVGDLPGLRRFLGHARRLLRPDGQLIFDSSDVAYLYEDSPMPTGRYYGEISCYYGYKRMKTEPFSWLYIDYHTLERLADEEGWSVELLFEDGNDQYLVRMKPVT